MHTQSSILLVAWACGITSGGNIGGAHCNTHAISFGSCCRAARTVPSSRPARPNTRSFGPLQPPPGARPASTRPPCVNAIAVRRVQRSRAALLGVRRAQRRGAAAQLCAWAAALSKARGKGGAVLSDQVRQGVVECCGNARKLAAWGAAHGFCNETAQAPGVRMEQHSRRESSELRVNLVEFYFMCHSTIVQCCTFRGSPFCCLPKIYCLSGTSGSQIHTLPTGRHPAPVRLRQRRPAMAFTKDLGISTARGRHLFSSP